MTDPLRISAGEKTVEEILDALRDGRRVVVETEVLGSTHTITLRYDGETYYCDTPTTLHQHEHVEEMGECIRKHGYASDA